MTDREVFNALIAGALLDYTHWIGSGQPSMLLLRQFLDMHKVNGHSAFYYTWSTIATLKAAKQLMESDDAQP